VARTWPGVSSPDERASLIEDGRCPARQAEFRISAAATRAWRRAHPATLDDVLAFLADLQRIFGPVPADRLITLDPDIRL
jgi:hypothetical protein